MLLTGSAAPVSALDRSEGDFWTYDMDMIVEGVGVTGKMTVTFEGYDTITVGALSYDVGVLAMWGDYSGSVELLGSPMVVSGVIIGTSYETKDGYGTVKEDVTMYKNVTWGEAPLQIVSRNKVETVTTCTPPRDSGFDPSVSGPGDSWVETVTEVTTAYVDDVYDSDLSGTDGRTYSYAIAPSLLSATVPAGTFETLKITATDEDGGSEFMWFSEEVGDAVRIEYYSQGQSDPYTSFELTEYSHDTGSFSTMMLMLAGVGVAVAVVAIVALLVLMKRRSGPTQVPPPIQPAPMVPPPPPPQQYPPSPPSP